jgi:membrane-associated phospholipid phosphatase
MEIEMESLLDWGVAVIVWLQQWSCPELDILFKAFTWMGNEGCYLVILPFVYWCVDRGSGARLAVLLLFSVYVNAVVKSLAHQPRPFQYDPAVKRMVSAGGGGFPSGHTQGTAVVWGYIMNRFRRNWVWATGIVMMVFVPLSRLYLGVHFPTDLLGGYVIGAILLLLWLWLEPPIEKWLSGKGLLWHLAAAVGGPLFLVMIFIARETYILVPAGSLMGLAVGIVLERRWIGFEAEGSWNQRAIRFVLGAAILLAIHWGVNAAFSYVASDAVFRFFRYLVVGFWISFVSPWIFVKLGLAEKRNRAATHRTAARGSGAGP